MCFLLSETRQKSLKLFKQCIFNSTLTSTIIHGWTRGLENKGAAKQKGGPPYFFRTPPRGGVRKKKWGAKGKGGARTPRTPPEYASAFHNALAVRF